jgi:hypothetical protein
VSDTETTTEPTREDVEAQLAKMGVAVPESMTDDEVLALHDELLAAEDSEPSYEDDAWSGVQGASPRG